MRLSTRAVLICVLLLIDISVATSLAAESPPTWRLSGAKIYAAPDADPITDGVLLLRAGKIAAIGARDAIKPPPGVHELECQGGVITAGYQNSHVHFTGEQFSNAQNALPADLERHLGEMLTRYGFTTVVDTASDRDNTLALRARIESGKVRGPRILTAGCPCILTTAFRPISPISRNPCSTACRSLQRRMTRSPSSVKICKPASMGRSSSWRRPRAIEASSSCPMQSLAPLRMKRMQRASWSWRIRRISTAFALRSRRRSTFSCTPLWAWRPHGRRRW